MMHLRLRFFHNAGMGRIVIFLGALAITGVFSWRVWIMLNNMFGFWLKGIPAGSMIIASIFAPVIGCVAVWLFLQSDYSKQDIRDYESEYGSKVRKVEYADGTVGFEHYERVSAVAWIYFLYAVVWVSEGAAIWLTVKDAGLDSTTETTSLIFSYALMLAPCALGKILHRSINKPAWSYNKEQKLEEARLTNVRAMVQIREDAKVQKTDAVRKYNDRLAPPRDAAQAALPSPKAARPEQSRIEAPRRDEPMQRPPERSGQPVQTLSPFDAMMNGSVPNGKKPL